MQFTVAFYNIYNCTCHVAHCVEYIEHTKCNRLLSTYLLLRIYTQFYQNIVHMRMCVLLRICTQFLSNIT
jgi:hypothetical protein